mgnify:FL=1
MRAPPADPAVVDKLRSTFAKISGEDMEIDAYELKDVLNAAYGNGKLDSNINYSSDENQNVNSREGKVLPVTQSNLIEVFMFWLY